MSQALPAGATSQPGALRRDARIIGLLFASTTSMIGSGWLFGSFHAARIAGRSPSGVGSSAPSSLC